MVITIPNSTLGEKIVSSSSEPLLDLFEDKFSPTLGGDLKVCSIPTVMKKNLEYNPESAPRRIAYDEICCAVNPHKSVLSRSHHIENTKKISVGRLMRFGCKINYLKRRRRRQRLVSLPDKFLFTPSSHGMEIFEPVLSNSATGQHITAPSFPPFKLIECKFLIAPGRNINGWKLSPANLSPVMNEDHRSKGIAYEKSTSRVERSGCKINYLRRRRQILAAHENRKKLAPTPNKPATFLIAPGVSVKAGSVEYKDGSPRPRIAYEESCRDEPVLSIMNKYGSPRPRKESCLDEPVLSNCDGDKIAPPCALTEPRFKFTECHEASLFPGRTIKIRTMSDTQNMGNTSVMKSVGNLNDLTSPLPRGILYQTSCIEAKTKSEGLDDEQRKMLYRATAILLKNHGLTNSARALLKEANIKKIDCGAEPPDIEGIFLSFLKKGESAALEKVQLNQLASSLEMMKLSISYGTSDPKDDSIFSKYSWKVSEEESILSSSPIEYFCDKYTIEMAGIHELTDERDIFDFFREASIEVESIQFHGKEPDFNKVMRQSATIRFRRVEDTKKAVSMNGSYLGFIKRKTRSDVIKTGRGSHVFMSRFANEYRVLCVPAFEEKDLEDFDLFVGDAVNCLFADGTAIEFVTASRPDGHNVGYVVVKATRAFQDLLVESGGRFFPHNGVLVRQANLTAEAFGKIFPTLPK